MLEIPHQLKDFSIIYKEMRTSSYKLVL